MVELLLWLQKIILIHERIKMIINYEFTANMRTKP